MDHVCATLLTELEKFQICMCDSKSFDSVCGSISGYTLTNFNSTYVDFETFPICMQINFCMRINFGNVSDLYGDQFRDKF
jgi:hypothetical protein